MTSPKSTFVYVSFIRTTPQKLWAALTSPDFIRQYWFGMTCESDFVAGAPWTLKFSDGRLADTGEILQSDPPRLLSIKWRNEFRPELKAEGWSTCVFELEEVDGTVKLAITHSIDVADSQFVVAVSGGWPKVISNLKSLMETGDVALSAAY